MSIVSHAFNPGDPLQVKKEKLALENEHLEKKLQILKERVRKWQEQPESISHVERDSYSSMGSVADVEEEQKTTSSIVIQATEQLVDVKVLYYNAKTLPNNGFSKPGMWKKVAMDMIIANTLKASLTFIIDAQPNSNKPIEALCSTVGTKLARLELADFIETLNNRNDLAELVSGFRAYAYLSQERREILNEICTNYEEYLKTFIADQGILLKWVGGLFSMTWLVGWNENLGKMVHNIDLLLKPENRDFNMACEEAFNKITMVSSTSVERVKALQTIISEALTYT